MGLFDIFKKEKSKEETTIKPEIAEEKKAPNETEFQQVEEPMLTLEEIKKKTEQAKQILEQRKKSLEQSNKRIEQIRKEWEPKIEQAIKIKEQKSKETNKFHYDGQPRQTTKQYTDTEHKSRH